MQRVKCLSVLAVSLVAAGTAWASTTTHTCVTSGSGPTYMKVCISEHGNVVTFESPQGKKHIRVYSDSAWPASKNFLGVEGYSVCWSDPDYLNYPEGIGREYDLGYYWHEPLGWDEPYKIEQPGGANTFPLRIYRRGWDGWELKQEFSRDTTERELTITMTLFNRSAETRDDVILVRFADLDIDNDHGDDADYVSSRSAVVGEGGRVGNAVAMTSLTANAYAKTGDATSSYTDDIFWYCGWPGEEFTPDRVGVVYYDLQSIPAGASRTVKLVYRAF